MKGVRPIKLLYSHARSVAVLSQLPFQLILISRDAYEVGSFGGPPWGATTAMMMIGFPMLVYLPVDMSTHIRDVSSPWPRGMRLTVSPFMQDAKPEPVHGK